MKKDLIRIDLNKNSKLAFYLKHLFISLSPSSFYNADSFLKNNLSRYDKEYIYKRVNYYNKIESNFQIDSSLYSIKEFKKKAPKKTYYFDLLKYLKYFDENLKISYLFGDITEVPKTPTVLKSRPISVDNKNSILMKLNSVRHFIFVSDNINFEDKIDKLVWRGKSYKAHRTEFLKKFYNNELCNVGQTNTKGDLSVPWQKEKLSISEQLKYKFILAIEGNDVASNLKWAMSSNSLVFMTKPKYETWFMEGLLKPNFHYVLLKDDYSDLEQKIEYFSKNISHAKEIIQNAHNFVDQFKDEQRELLISLLVLKKYFEKSNQLSV